MRCRLYKSVHNQQLKEALTIAVYIVEYGGQRLEKEMKKEKSEKKNNES